MKHSGFLPRSHSSRLSLLASICCGLLPCQMPFSLKTGLFVSAAISWQIERQAGRYLRLLCTPACLWLGVIPPLSDGTVRSSRDSYTSRSVCFSQPRTTTASELSQTPDLWPSHAVRQTPLLVFKNAPMRMRALNQEAVHRSNCYTSTAWRETGFKSLLGFWADLSAKPRENHQEWLLLLPGWHHHSEAWITMS